MLNAQNLREVNVCSWLSGDGIQSTWIVEWGLHVGQGRVQRAATIIHLFPLPHLLFPSLSPPHPLPTLLSTCLDAAFVGGEVSSLIRGLKGSSLEGRKGLDGSVEQTRREITGQLEGHSCVNQC